MIALLLDFLAVFRLARLVTTDTLTEGLRDKIVEAAYITDGRGEVKAGTADSWSRDVVADDPHPPKLAVLITCPWCSSVYLAFGVVILRRVVPRLWAPISEALAMSAVAGLVASNLDHE